MSSKKNNNNFLIQGSILAAASLISRVIGLIYRVPLTRIIGKTGNNYYASAYEIYNILLIISSYSIPLAVSKMVASSMGKKEPRNAYRVFRAAIVFALMSGLIAAGAVFLGGEYFTAVLLKTPLSIIALRVLMPTLVIVAVLGVIRGFFQGLGTMIPSAVSQIIEQIINAVISVAAAYYLFNYGNVIGKVLGNVEKYSASYGAAGGTLGTTVGAFAAFLFMLFLFIIFRTQFIKKVRRDKSENKDSYFTIVKVLIMTIVPVLLSTTIYNISGIVDQGIYKNIALLTGFIESEIDISWGIFAGEYKVLINVPISIATAIAASCVPSLTRAFQAKDYDESRRQMSISSRFVMIIAFPCAVGLFVLASPIMQLLFKDDTTMAKNMLMLGAITIVLYSLSTLSNGLLQGIDKLRTPVINAAIALVTHVLFLVLLLYTTKLGVYTVILANAFYALVMCILNQLALRKYIGLTLDYIKTFAIPAVSSIGMGLIVFLLYKLMYMLIGSDFIGIVLGILVGAFCYFAILVLLRGISKEELYRAPKGEYLVLLGEKMHLFRGEDEE